MAFPERGGRLQNLPEEDRGVEQQAYWLENADQEQKSQVGKAHGTNAVSVRTHLESPCCAHEEPQSSLGSEGRPSLAHFLHVREMEGMSGRLLEKTSKMTNISAERVSQERSSFR